MKFRKKPVVIEAIQWTGDNVEEITLFMERAVILERGKIIIPTLEGEMQASRGDWIIRGVFGEFYPCKHDIFEETYENAE